MNNIHERLNVLALATSYTVQNNEPYPGSLTSSSQSVTDIKTAKVMETFLTNNKKYFNIEDTENLDKIKARYQHWIKYDPCDKECASLIATIDEIVSEAAFIMPPQPVAMHPRFAAAPRLLEDLKQRRHQFGPKDFGYLNDLLLEFTDLATGNDVPPVVQELTLFLFNLLGELENKRQNILSHYTLQNAGETFRSLQMRNLNHHDIPYITSLMDHYGKLIASKTNDEDIRDAIDLTMFLASKLSSLREEAPSLELKNARAILEFLNNHKANITQDELSGLITAREAFVNLVGNASHNIDLTDSVSLIEYLNELIAELTPAAPAAPAVARRVNNDDDDGDAVPIVILRDDAPPKNTYRYIEKVHVDAYDSYQKTKYVEITPENVFKLAALADDHKNRDLMDECSAMLSYFLSASNEPNLKGIIDVCKGLLRVEANVTVGEDNKKPRVDMSNFPNSDAIEMLVQLDRLVDFDLVLPRHNINAEQLNALEKKLFHTTISASGS